MQNLTMDGPDAATGNGKLAALNKLDFAARYDVSKRTLDGWLAAGCPHLKLSSRMVRIPVKEGDEWVKGKVFAATAQVNHDHEKMKSPLRFSRASGSTVRRVERFFRRGERTLRRQLNSARRRELQNWKGGDYAR